MKIFFMNWNSYGNIDFLDALSHLSEDGSAPEVIKYPFQNTEKRDDPEFESRFSSDLQKEVPDFVFSFNYYPLISKVCNREGVKYVSWVYDSPHIALYSYTLINKCNYIFLFDSQMYENFASKGIRTVYYLPLAASVRRLDAVRITPEIQRRYGAGVSFVGAMYTEAHNFYDRMEPGLDDYTKGYLQGLMAAQMQIDGMNFVENCLSQNVLERMLQAYPMIPNVDGVESSAYMYAQYMLNRKITSVERTQLIRQIGEKYPVKLYTKDKEFTASGVTCMGQIDYYDAMPYVFKCSDINLNITLRSIQRGIPLRAMDIMGCGGFLLTNYQEDLLQFFTPGEDFVYYESHQDLLDRIGYYQTHEDERRRIAENAHRKVATDHTYDIRIRQMLEIVMA